MIRSGGSASQNPLGRGGVSGNAITDPSMMPSLEDELVDDDGIPTPGSENAVRKDDSNASSDRTGSAENEVGGASKEIEEAKDSLDKVPKIDTDVKEDPGSIPADAGLPNVRIHVGKCV